MTELAHLADKFDKLAKDTVPTAVKAAHAIGGYGRKAYMDNTRSSGLLPGSLAATHGKIKGRNRAASVGYTIHDDGARQNVTITPRGDLWWVRAQGREQKGAHSALRYTKGGKIRHGKTKRSTPPLAAAPRIYKPAQDAIGREAPKLVDQAVVDQLGRFF
jgi:hypothetical protein